MNPEEKDCAATILKRTKESVKNASFYLQFMRAVKIRLEVEKMVRDIEKEAKK